MTKSQRRKLVDLLNDAKDFMQGQDDFMADDELKAMFVVVSAAEAAAMFNEEQALAAVCAKWCEDTGRETTERN